MAACAQRAIGGQNVDGPGKSIHPGAVMSTWFSYSKLQRRLRTDPIRA
jgi:hypothetical protein